MGVTETDPLSQLSLPPGFRFFPTDEELLVQYLCRKVAGHSFSLQIIGDIDLYKFDPWVLPSKAIFGEKEWYFFSPRDRKYPNGSRPNRVAGTGYWKATGTDKIITTEGRKVGIKKALVFYVGKAPKGTKTNWIMHEYRLIEPSRKSGSSKLDDWVLCRIYKKSSGAAHRPGAMMMMSKEQYSNGSASSTSSSHGLDDVLESLPAIDDRFFSLPRVNSLKTLNQDSNGGEDKLAGLFNLGSGSFDWASLAGINSVPDLVPSTQAQAQAQCAGTVGYSGDLYVPSIPPLRHADSPARRVGYNSAAAVAAAAAEEEVQSGLRTQYRLDSSGFFQQNSGGGLTQGFSSNSLDPYAFRYPDQLGGFGFGR